MPTETEAFVDDELRAEREAGLEAGVFLGREHREKPEAETLRDPVEEPQESIEPGKQAVLDQKGGGPDDWALEYKGDSGYRFDGQNIRDPEGTIWVNEDKALHQEMLAQWAEGGSMIFFLPDYRETSEEKETLYVTSILLGENGEVTYSIYKHETLYSRNEDASADIPEYAEVLAEEQNIFEELTESERQDQGEVVIVPEYAEVLTRERDVFEEPAKSEHQDQNEAAEAEAAQPHVGGVEPAQIVKEAPTVDSAEPASYTESESVGAKEPRFEYPGTSGSERPDQWLIDLLAVETLEDHIYETASEVVKPEGGQTAQAAGEHSTRVFSELSEPGAPQKPEDSYAKSPEQNRPKAVLADTEAVFHAVEKNTAAQPTIRHEQTRVTADTIGSEAIYLQIPEPDQAAGKEEKISSTSIEHHDGQISELQKAETIFHALGMPLVPQVKAESAGRPVNDDAPASLPQDTRVRTRRERASRVVTRHGVTMEIVA